MNKANTRHSIYACFVQKNSTITGTNGFYGLAQKTLAALGKQSCQCWDSNPGPPGRQSCDVTTKSQPLMVIPTTRRKGAKNMAR